MPLLIGPDEIAGLKRLREHAEANPYSLDDMLDRMNGELETPGDQEKFICFLPVGYKVVFTIETHPSGPMRVMSVSVGNGETFPTVAGAEMLLDLLGFAGGLKQTRVEVEKETILMFFQLIDRS